MDRFRRLSLQRVAALCVAGALSGGVVQAQTWPQGPVTIVVPWAPGGVTDLVARAIGQPLAQSLGQSVVVDNKPGAGGNIGTTQAVRAKADGQTLILVTSTTQAINPHLYSKLAFDPAKDFTPVVYIGSVPNILVVSAKSPLKSLDDVLNQARQKPGSISYASGGNGSSQHVAGALLESVAKIEMLHVPYKGAAPALADVIAGQVDLILDTASISHIRAGTVRPIAVASDQRIAALPDVPTFAELGLSGMKASAWYGVMGPAGLPPDVITRLNTEINRILKEPDIVKRLQDMGMQITGGSPQDFGRFADEELQRYGEIVRQRSIKAD